MTVAFYGFQRAPHVRVITPDTGWLGWFNESARPLIERGYSVQHLHNPFGLYKIRDRAMHIDQFDLADCMGLEEWLANSQAFAEVVNRIHQQGGTVQAYIGSPLVIPPIPRLSDLPKCMPGARSISAQIRILRMLGRCSTREAPCLCWHKLISFYLSVLVNAKVDAIGFDDSRDFHPGDCMDRLVRRLIAGGMEVMIEPWPITDREYPQVSWIIRELLFQRIRLEGRKDQAPIETVVGKIYRIVPNDGSDDGQAEITKINEILARHQETGVTSTQEIVNNVRSAGHIPIVRAQQLRSGSVR